MYKLNVDDKALVKLAPTSFGSRNLLERYDIQEWIEKTPAILGEDLLIIGKELQLQSGSRLDLLAIDRNARLVIVELKRDDSGKEVDWQAIKYTSYCSNFLVEEVVGNYAVYLNSDEEDARSRIDEFIDVELELLNNSQRIILVSKEYHSDVISAVLWLRDYGVDIECLRLTPFVDDKGDLFIQPDKIIPLPEAKDYILKKERKRIEIKKAQSPFEKGDVIESVNVLISIGTYRLERYDSHSISVYNCDAERCEMAKPVLRMINDEKRLRVSLTNSSGRSKNTRSLGKEIIAELKAQGKACS
ncbi:PDDEXK family nuclease [Pontiella desulfatans]|nr:endonuclease NucS domain-containing protein [Pontiella desulfatans]